ncbi:hypothetical protein LINPERHAP1_LOCUS21900 [Linum perenne]
MGLLKSKGVIYKTAKTIDVAHPSDDSQSYLSPNVKAPRMSGIVVKAVAWFLESKIFGASLLYILKKNNLIHKGG